MKNIIINASAAYKSVLAELHLCERDVEFYDVSLNDGLYEFAVFTAWMRYDCYVDAADGIVLGLSSQPMLLCSLDKHEGKFDYLRSGLDFTA